MIVSWEELGGSKREQCDDDVKGDDGEVGEEDKEEVEEGNDRVEEEKEDKNIYEYIKLSKLKA